MTGHDHTSRNQPSTLCQLSAPRRVQVELDPRGRAPLGWGGCHQTYFLPEGAPVNRHGGVGS